MQYSCVWCLILTSNWGADSSGGDDAAIGEVPPRGDAPIMFWLDTGVFVGGVDAAGVFVFGTAAATK